MCLNIPEYRIGWARVRRPVVRLKRLHAYAAIRWADAQTPAAMRFWKAIMDSCIRHEYEWQAVGGVSGIRRLGE